MSKTAAQPSFTPDVAGDYTIELVVSDGTVTSNTDEIVVTAGNNTATQSIGPGGGQIVVSGDTAACGRAERLLDLIEVGIGIDYDSIVTAVFIFQGRLLISEDDRVISW